MTNYSAQGIVLVKRKPATADEAVLKQQITLVAKDGAKMYKISDLTQFIEDLEGAGIIVDENSITLVAKQTKVQGINGNPIAVFNDDGSINANLINAKQVVADGLKANTFDAGNATINNLIVNNAQVTGKITATSGSIGGFEIGDSYIGSKSYDDSSHLLIRNRQILIGSSYRWAAIGPDALTSGMKNTFAIHDEESDTAIEHVGAHISVTGSNYNDNTALFVKASGSKSGNHAIYIADGDIAGLRLNTHKGDTRYTITKYDNIIVNTATNNNAVYTFPAPSDLKGHVIIFINKYNYTSKVNGKFFFQTESTSFTTERFGSYIFISDGAHWIYKKLSWT